MLPGFPTTDSANQRFGYSKLEREGLQSSDRAKTAYFDDHVFSEYGMVPSFVNHVSDVLLIRSKKKVCRVDAWRSIAVVTDKKPGRYFAEHQQPCHSMGPDKDTLLTRKLSVTIPCVTSSPKPARIGLMNFGPKSLLKGLNRSSSMVAGVGAEFSAAQLDPPSLDGESRSADFTNAFEKGNFSGHLEPPVLGAMAPDSSTYRGAFFLAASRPGEYTPWNYGN